MIAGGAEKQGQPWRRLAREGDVNATRATADPLRGVAPTSGAVRMTRPAGWAVAAVVVTATLAACTAPGTPPPERAGTTAPTGSSSPDPPSPTQSVPPQPAVMSDDDLFWYLVDFSPDDGDDDEQVRRYEESVARCMADAGFEYVPNTPTGEQDSEESPEHDEEWYATYGYGISIEPPPPPPLVPDPNADYVASLSEQGQEAYRIALDGEPWLEDGSPSEALGCRASAMVAVRPEGGYPQRPALLEELLAQVDEATRQVLNGPLMADARVAFVDCVVAAGAEPFDFEHGESAHTQVEDAYRQLTANGTQDPAVLAEFQRWERDIAVADRYRCRQPLLQVQDNLAAQAVREVVGPHRAELEALAMELADR